MSIDLSAFRVLIKKIFPPKKSVFTVDTTGNGRADSILLKAQNLILPFVVPEKIEFGDHDAKSFDFNDFDLSERLKIKLDDLPIDLSKNTVNMKTMQESFLIYHKGESFKIDEILRGKLGGRTIALGDFISILIKLDSKSLERLTKGKHVLSFEGENVPKLEINFELHDENMNQKFDPKST